MNIAFSTILFFLFIVPGLAFRRFYYTGEFSKEYFKSSSAEVFVMGIIPSLLLHWLGLHLINWLTPTSLNFLFTEISIPSLTVNFQLIGIILTGKGNDQYLLSGLKEIGLNLDYIISYNLILTLLGVVLGFLCKVIVRKLKLDRSIKILRFQNEWHYVLTSEVLDFPRVKTTSPYNKNGKVLSAVYIDALVDVSEKDGAMLYSGILEDYRLSKDGGLDVLYLTNAYRRSLQADPAENINSDDQDQKELDSERPDKALYYYMPEHYFILKYEEIKNLNIYYDFKETEPRRINKEDLTALLGLVIIFAIFFFSIKLAGWVLGIIVGIIITSILSRLGNDEIESTDNDSEDNQEPDNNL
ncbi:hypothetical protein AWW67_12775 [Roseivirga seohaensis]|uniref:Uncharacterized protein n=1 Tax=Roseivirga seohaensis TaxID=1914963 RepID=A0A150XKI3_9BACT|nr:hypothetical protein [Roseivirga seohaensis]KYG79248.1 hypothetical protein AWW67_12775 [Roseivirga seohaensis]